MDAESTVLAVMILAHSTGVVLSPGYRCDLAEPAGESSGADTPVTVDAVLASGSVLANMRRAVVDVVGAVLPSVAARAFTPGTQV